MELNDDKVINAFLENLDKNDLIEIILDLTKKDDLLQEMIIYKYSIYNDKEQLIKTKELLNSIVKKYACKDGFIYDKDVCELSKDLGVILHKANVINNKLLGIEITFLVLEEVLKYYEYINDYIFFAKGMVSEITQTICAIGS